MSTHASKQQPKRGLYFPLTVSEVRRVTKEAGLVNSEGRPISIRHENPQESERDRLLLACLYPLDELLLFSIPDGSDPAIMAGVCMDAVRSLGRYGTRSIVEKKYERCFIQAVADLLERKVRIIRTHVRMQIPRYRGTSKFSNAFKASAGKLRRTELASFSFRKVPLVQASELDLGVDQGK